MKTVDIHHSFQQPINHAYPPHCSGDMIEEAAKKYFETVPDKGDWTFIPVNWTGWFCNNEYGKNTAGLRQYIRSLRLPHGKYFTIVQNDDGTMCDDILREIGCTIFGAGGVGDIPIPLLCTPHPEMKMSDNPSYLASFVGSMTTHPIRKAMGDAINKDSRFFIGKGGTNLFRALMADSKFALCPRGYGRTSYRLYEAIQLGCVPVYIYDEAWFPFFTPDEWCEFCVLIDGSFLGDIVEILANIPDCQRLAMRERCKVIYKDYFNMEKTCEWVYKWLS